VKPETTRSAKQLAGMSSSTHISSSIRMINGVCSEEILGGLTSVLVQWRNQEAQLSYERLCRLQIWPYLIIQLVKSMYFIV